MDSVRGLLQRLDCSEGVEIRQGIFPEETGHLIAGQKFRFCHIDVDVYESARDIVEWVWPRMLPGGIVVFDDYAFYVCGGITQLVNEYRASADRLIIHNLNGHGLMVKKG
jgi:O-methyltransferase